MIDMGKIKEYFKIYESEETKAVFEQNDYEGNRLSYYVILSCAVILLISWGLNLAGVFTVPKLRMNVLAILGLIEFAIPVVLYLKFKGQRRWLKYVMVIALLFACTQLFSILNHNVILIMVLPVMLSSRYFSKGFTVMISILTVIFATVGSILTVLFGIIDLNFYPSPEKGTVIVIEQKLREAIVALGIDPSKAVVSMMVNGFLPRLLAFTVICFISIYIAKRGHDMVLRQNEIARASANVKAELNTATQIQNGMVPSIFPAFPGRKEFDIHAGMYTAKEVGGDFYDFFLIDEKHLAMVIADVSGKGVPAALFMMVTSILISERMRTGSYSPAEVLSEVNNKVCSRNRAGLFVTVWLGILEVSTGRIVCANAGHDDPVVCRKNGEFELVKSRHGLVLGTIEEIQYKDLEFTLNSGDKLFLFTDGIPDAKNAAGKRFKIDGMLSALNLHRNKTPQGIIKGVKESVDAFVGDAPQFDDITMLCLEMNGSVVRKSLTTEAVLDQLDEVKGLVNGVLDEVGCPKKIRKKITLSVEEVFVNIANYAYGSDGGTVSVDVEGSCTGVAITFRDSGVPYDPLKKPDPDVTLSVDQRQIGGLGVYLVKKNMDTLSYSYIDNQNVLTITKYFSA